MEEEKDHLGKLIYQNEDVFMEDEFIKSIIAKMSDDNQFYQQDHDRLLCLMCQMKNNNEEKVEIDLKEYEKINAGRILPELLSNFMLDLPQEEGKPWITLNKDEREDLMELRKEVRKRVADAEYEYKIVCNNIEKIQVEATDEHKKSVEDIERKHLEYQVPRYQDQKGLVTTTRSKKSRKYSRRKSRRNYP
jgi:hypothetical protein